MPVQCSFRRFCLDYHLSAEDNNPAIWTGCILGVAGSFLLVYGLSLGEVKGMQELQHQHVCMDMSSDEGIPGLVSPRGR